MSGQFEIVFLGTGSPLPSVDRCGAGQVIVAGETNILVDCGWGAARRLVPAGVRPPTINVAIFTHMHSDHITDVPDFLFQRWAYGSSTPLRVYGPEGTQEMVDGFLLALRRDIGFRIAHHGEKMNPDGIKVEVTELPATATPQQFLKISGLALESFEVDHFPVAPALGFRATYDGRTVVLSGDTAFCESLLEASRGADMLVCEAINVTMLQRQIDGLRGSLPYQAAMLEDVPSYHIPTPDVARVANEAGVGELVLSHLIPSIQNDDAMEQAFIQGMSDVYRGKITVARDTQRIAVKKRAG
jgi:ribonuclease Z